MASYKIGICLGLSAFLLAVCRQEVPICDISTVDGAGTYYYHNPVAVVRFGAYLESLGHQQRIRVLESSYPQYQLAARVVICALFEQEGAQPLYWEEYADQQKEIRETFPKFPLVIIGQLPFFIDPSDVVDTGGQPGSYASYAPFKECLEWVSKGSLSVNKQIAADPLAIVDDFIESAGPQAWLEKALGRDSPRYRRVVGRLRMQAYLSLEGALGEDLDVTRDITDEQWAVLRRRAKNRQLTWNPRTLKYEVQA